LKLDVPETLPIGQGDERRLTQVLMNLVGNAIKFTQSGFVEVAARAVDDTFVITVSDTGPGISPADQARIFDEFQQVDSSSTRQQGGTGLGLSIARQLVLLHGGRIEVRSELGQGAVFQVTLPIRTSIERKKAS
jgi:signal transduction histidine kinase